jgi:uncharacterized protein (TIGR02300 family)
MAKPELGSKRVCVSCSASFYDLMRDPAVCPKCGIAQPAEVPKMKSRAGNVPTVSRKPKDAAAVVERDADVEPVADDEEDETEEEASDSDDDLDEDAGTIPDEIDVEGGKDDVER